MALPWIIGAAAVAVVGAIAASSSNSSSSSSSSSSREREERERIERENERKREEARKREREETERKKQAKLEAKRDFAVNQARELFYRNDLELFADEEEMAKYALKGNDKAKTYAMECWDSTFSQANDEDSTELEERRKQLNSLKKQLQG